MNTSSEFLPGDEILHPWSAAVATRTLERCSELKNTGTAQETRWAEISRNIYDRMATRHDVVGRVLQGFFFAEHPGGPAAPPSLAEVQARLRDICKTVRRTRRSNTGATPYTSHEEDSVHHGDSDEQEAEVEAISYVCGIMERVLASGETPSLLDDMVPLACRLVPVAGVANRDQGDRAVREWARGCPPGEFSEAQTRRDGDVGGGKGRPGGASDAEEASVEQPRTLEAIFRRCLARFTGSTPTPVSSLPLVAKRSREAEVEANTPRRRVSPPRIPMSSTSAAGHGGSSGLLLALSSGLPPTAVSRYQVAQRYSALGLPLEPTTGKRGITPSTSPRPSGTSFGDAGIRPPPRPALFPFGVISLQERRRQAVQAEETRGDATLIRPDTVIAPPAWKKDGESVFHSSSSSSDDDEEKKNNYHHHQDDDHKRAFVLGGAGVEEGSPDQGRTTEAEVEERKATTATVASSQNGSPPSSAAAEDVDSKTTYITNGELVMVRGRFEMRALPEKKERQRRARKIDLHFSHTGTRIGAEQPPPPGSASANQGEGKAAVAAEGEGEGESPPPPRRRTTVPLFPMPRAEVPDTGVELEAVPRTSVGGLGSPALRDDGGSSVADDSAERGSRATDSRHTRAKHVPMGPAMGTSTSTSHSSPPTSSSSSSSSPNKTFPNVLPRSGQRGPGSSTSKSGTETKNTKRGGGARLPLSVVSVEGVPRKTREEMRALLMEWPLSPLLRQAFMIGVEED